MSKFLLLAASALALGQLGQLALADLYMQANRGSNNRLDEANRDRNNGNRLFDSQNNARGGYNVGKLSYYYGESVPISWTNQHSSGLYQLKGTELILQYACGSLMRDGTTTNTIPDDPEQCYNYDCDTDVEYGRHESYSYYQYCKAQERNMGLFTANQNLNPNNRRAAINTRQNSAGTRRGYECPEERDYYPYWRPSPWRDIAIYTNQPDRCDAYKRESQNRRSKWQCTFNDVYWEYVLKGRVDNNHRAFLPSNASKCMNAMEFLSPVDNETYLPYYTYEEIPSHGIDDPICEQAITTRANHHGLTGGRGYWTHEWIVPDLSRDRFYSKEDRETCCVIRARYNITTGDYMAWESDSSINAGLDYRNNSEGNNPNPDTDPANVKIWERFGLTYDDIMYSFDGNPNGDNQKRSRGYVFRNNPRVDPFGHIFDSDPGNDDEDDLRRIQLQLAINTNQFGRTFQDRTHCFQIKSRPSGIGNGQTIKLLTVQGKRGNIVQVYPATEYFFIPEPLTVSVGDYVHFCWTGSNTNPNNNAGQGKEGTDRSNICPLNMAQYDFGDYSDIDGNYNELNGDSPYGVAVGVMGSNYPAWVDTPDYEDDLPEYVNYAQMRELSTPRMGGFDQEILNDLCTTRRPDKLNILDYGNMEELDDAGTTFCIEPVRATSKGKWNFLCTRNNNFSNRSQKGSLQVMDGSVEQGRITSEGGRVSGGKGQAIAVVYPGQVEEGDTLEFELTTFNRPGKDSTIVLLSGIDGGEFDSSVFTEGGYLELWIPYTPASIHQPTVYKSSDSDYKWKKPSEGRIDYTQETHYAVTDTSSGGYYKSVNVINAWAIICVIVAVGATSVGMGFLLKKKCKR